MNPEQQYVIGTAIEKLWAQLIPKRDELHRRETSQGTSHDVAKMNRLREEIAGLERRIERAERLQDNGWRPTTED